MTLSQARIWGRERRRQALMEHAVLSLCGVPAEPAMAVPSAKRDQAIGEFCGGSCIHECTKQFGEALWLACRTCPD